MRTFKSAKKRAKKSAFTNKSAQKSTLKSTFGSSEPIWQYCDISMLYGVLAIKTTRV